ncbi:porin family protein [Halpernia sp.]|uniref:porin family protein n=1 Tax=Halpernia sp. TaxID=2782209 RepID=UPI003A95A508
MKKVFLAAAIAASSLTFAQQFGIKGGMNVSSLSKDSNLSDQSSKIGFNAGVFLNAPLSSDFSIQPEVIYNDLGSKVDRTSTVGGNNYTASYSRNLGYISVPVMFQYNATPQFYLEAGPQMGFLVNAEDKYKSSTNGNTNNSTIVPLNKDNFNNFDFGVGIGAGYYFTPQLGITARYVAGVTDILKNNNGDSVKNNAFQVGLAYKFGK